MGTRHQAKVNIEMTDTSIEFTLGLSFLLGAIHALEPGHGKTAMLVYLVGDRKSYWHPIIMGVSTALSHSVSLLLIAFSVHLTHHLLTHDHAHEMFVSRMLQWFSAVLVIVVGLWMVVRAWTGTNHACCSHHEHCDHDHSDLVQLGESQVNADTSDRSRSSFSTTAILGLAVGLLPCPSALAAYFSGLSTGQPWLAYSIIGLFAVGIATSLCSVGIIVQVFGNRLSYASNRLSNLPWNTIRACLILSVGIFYIAKLLLFNDEPHNHLH